MRKRLREAVNDVVVQYVTLIDMVLEQDEKHQGPLLAQIIGSLSSEYLERRGLIQTRRHDN